MNFLKQATYIRYVYNSKTKVCPNQHAELIRLLFIEDSKNLKGPGTSFQVTFCIELYDKKFTFVILHKLVKFHYQTVFTSQFIQ